METIQVYKDFSLESQTVQTLSKLVEIKSKSDGLPVVQLNVMFLQETINFFANQTSGYGQQMTKKYTDLKINKDSVLKILREAIIRGNYLDRENGDYYFTLRKGNNGEHNLEAQPKKSTLIQEAYLSGQIIDHKQPQISFNENGELEKIVISFCRKGGRWEDKVFTKSDFDRLSNFSRKNNTFGSTQEAKDKAKPNELYFSGKNGTIDPSFAASKAERHTYKHFVRNPMQALAQSPFSAPRIEPDNQTDQQATFEDIEVEEVANNTTKVHIQLNEIIDLPL